MVTAADLEKIINGPGTKADRARALVRLGCDRVDLRDLLGMNYSQAHTIWKEIKDDAVQGRQKSVEPRNSGAASRRLDPRRASGRIARDQRSSLSGSVLDDRASEGGLPEAGGPLHLSPAQTRYVTQDGHVIVRVDKRTGAECRHCGRRLQFSLRYLGFVHADSSAEPTKLEDRYVD